MLDSRWEFSTTISPIMRGLKTLIDTCVDFKNLRSLAIIGKENYTVQRSLESLWHTMVIPNADNNSCLVNVLFLNFYSMVILFFYIFITHTSWNFSFLSHMAWRPQIWQAKTRILESIMSRVTRELTRPPMSITQTLTRTKSFVIKKKICHKQRVLSWEKKNSWTTIFDWNYTIYYSEVKKGDLTTKKKNNKKIVVMSNWATRFSNTCVTVLS